MGPGRWLRDRRLDLFLGRGSELMGGEEGKGVSGEGNKESSGASESGKGNYGHLGGGHFLLLSQ